MSTDRLAARLECLERSHVRVKRLAALLALLLAATFAGAMNEDEVPEVVRAKRFEVVGKSGPVGAFYAYPLAEGAALTMLNRDHERVVALQSHDDGGLMTLSDGAAHDALRLWTAQGGGSVSVTGSEGGRVEMSSSEVYGATVTIRGEVGEEPALRLLRTPMGGEIEIFGAHGSSKRIRCEE